MKPAIAYRVAIGLSVLNLFGLAFALPAEPMHAAGHVVLAVLLVSWARRSRRAMGGHTAGEVRQQMDEHAAALENAQATLDDQARQLAELQERVDFAERMLIQARERPPENKK